MKIGDTVWYCAGPTFREHWVPMKVVGETSRSWIVGERYAERKLAKIQVSNGFVQGFALSQEQLDQFKWMNNHRYRLARQIESVHDYVTLKKLADLMGYKEEVA